MYELAARQGDGEAQYNLGVMYYMGNGVSRDYMKTFVWWYIAATNRDAAARQNLGLVAEKLPPGDVEKAKQLANTCLETNYKTCE